MDPGLSSQLFAGASHQETLFLPVSSISSLSSLLYLTPFYTFLFPHTFALCPLPTPFCFPFACLFARPLPPCHCASPSFPCPVDPWHYHFQSVRGGTGDMARYPPNGILWTSDIPLSAAGHVWRALFPGTFSPAGFRQALVGLAGRQGRAGWVGSFSPAYKLSHAYCCSVPKFWFGILLFPGFWTGHALLVFFQVFLSQASTIPIHPILGIRSSPWNIPFGREKNSS